MRVSVIFETKAILPAEATETWDLPYLNLVILGKTFLSPQGLLIKLKQIEKELGRDFNALRWSPRIIDLDILAWDQQIISQEGLTIPHQYLMHRPFLISLMALLKPDWRYPVSGFSYSHLTLSEILHCHITLDDRMIKCLLPFPQMMGIVNVTPDSFSDGGSYLNAKRAIERIQELSLQGAAVIDIGAQSTRPGALSISPTEEWQRLEPIFDFLAHDFALWPAKPYISLDSFNVEVIQKALQHYPIDWINDVRGNENPDFLKWVAETNCKIVINHSLSIPPSKKNILSFDTHPIKYIYEWAQNKIERFSAYGIQRDNIIVDPGIGFGKSTFQSLSLLREIKYLKKLCCEIIVGHSRKSFLNILTPQPTSERDLETIGISHYLLKQGVDYLRVHNIESHQRSLTASALLEGTDAF